MSEPVPGRSLPRATDRFRLVPDVRFRVVIEEGVVFRQKEAEVLVLNQVGARVLELVAPDRTVAEIADVLEAEFEVERGRLDADVASYIAELREAGVVESAPEPTDGSLAPTAP